MVPTPDSTPTSWSSRLGAGTCPATFVETAKAATRFYCLGTLRGSSCVGGLDHGKGPIEARVDFYLELWISPETAAAGLEDERAQRGLRLAGTDTSPSLVKPQPHNLREVAATKISTSTPTLH